MESEKVKEIKEALYCWQESVMLSIDGNYVSHKVYNREILDYINELEKENEKLKQHKRELQGGQQDLIKRIAELEKEKTCVWEEWTDGYHSIWCCSNCKEDFCFIEGDVYENNYGYCPHCGAKITALKEMQEEELDETLKEFINKGESDK